MTMPKTTKTAIADTLRGMAANCLAQLRYRLQDVADAVSALDVCTPAEREWLEASFKSYAAYDRAATERRLRAHDALERERAERTPPDPVEAFIAEVRKTRDGWANFTSVRCALDPLLAKLDAARGRK